MNFVMFLLKDEEARRLARTDDMAARKKLTLLEKKRAEMVCQLQLDITK